MNRCNNFPCQLSANHPGPCNSLSKHEQEMYSDRERHEAIQELRREQDEDEHQARLMTPMVTLERIEKYLTEQTDRAYVAYYRASQTDIWRQVKGRQVKETQEAWQVLGDARELVRRPLREMQQAKLRGTRTLIHSDSLREKGEQSR